MKTYRLEIFRDMAGEFRFRLVAPNGQCSLKSSEGYPTRSNAIRAARRIGKAIEKAEVSAA